MEQMRSAGMVVLWHQKAGKKIATSKVLITLPDAAKKVATTPKRNHLLKLRSRSNPLGIVRNRKNIGYMTASIPNISTGTFSSSDMRVNTGENVTHTACEYCEYKTERE